MMGFASATWAPRARATCRNCSSFCFKWPSSKFPTFTPRLGWFVAKDVYVSALVFGGKPAAVLQLAESGAFEVVVSATIKAELVETLTAKFGWSAERVERTCREPWDAAWWVLRPQQIRAARDPHDDHILGCALESHARTVVTGDHDLLALHPFQGVDVITPSDFLARGIWSEPT